MRSSNFFEVLENRQLLAATYRIVDLSASAIDAGFNSATVAGIDPTGLRVVGEASSREQSNVPIIWTAGAHGVRRVSILPTLGPGAAFATAVNSSGQIVGKFHLTSSLSSPTHACLWYINRRGRYVALALGTFRNTPASAFSEATAINSSGLIVGTVGGLADTSGGSTRSEAAAWALTATGRVIATAVSASSQPVGSDNGNQFSAVAVNDAGQIAGNRNNFTEMRTDAYLWRSTTSPGIDLGPEQCTALGADGTVATRTDMFDYIIGNAILFKPRSRTRFSQVPVPALPGAFRSEVYAINSGGVMVGSTANPGDLSTNTATSWTSSGATLTINKLSDQIPPGSAWTALNGVIGIDNTGQIIGTGTVSGISHPFLLIPTA